MSLSATRSLSVTITGSGTPLVTAGRAGPGALVRHGDTAIQVDAGRATALRVTEAGLPITELDALLVTHHHSDHLLGIPDLVLARWIANGPAPCPALPVHCPEGPVVDYLAHLFDEIGPDIDSRRGVTGYPDDPHPAILAFDAPTHSPTEVARYGDVLIEATTVDHGDLEPAVAFRFSTADGAIVVSGDTQVCPALEELARGADILVHEAFAGALLVRRGAPEGFIENLRHHHAESRKVGEMAARLEVPTLVITHMIPGPASPEETALFHDEI
ncbi:MAG: MBL fold metallo-hydrolase, partial [Acidimicrobiales bacterium]